ncbi:MAG TPA: MarC family protein [Polyangiaceae bacterium]|nr:MarC family protein [Polyangiaceae bacterium]
MAPSDLGVLGTTLAGFFASMNPIANIPIFLGLTEGLGSRARKRIALQSVLTAFCVIAAFTLLGQLIFSLFGITSAAFRLAGGIIVFLIGYRMLGGEPAKEHQMAPPPEPSAERASLVETSLELDPGVLSVAITPLGVPILAGPGTIVTAVGFSAGHWSRALITLVAFAVLCAITWLGFSMGGRLVRLLGHSFLTVITRLMGLILAVIGVQMFLHGLSEAGFGG